MSLSTLSCCTNAPQFQQLFELSDQTMARLETYVGVLTKWQRAINLIAPNTLPHIWQRHLVDCAQLCRLLPPRLERDTIGLDMGTGAGLPGLVLAILLDHPLYLIESDSRKCLFLREAARQTGTAVTILNKRLEHVAPLNARFLTARALAPLPRLLGYALPHCAQENSLCLFLKGQNWQREVADAQKLYDFTLKAIPSITESESRIVSITHLKARSS